MAVFFADLAGLVALPWGKLKLDLGKDSYSMKNFLFWQRWLLIVSVLVIDFGLAMMLLPGLTQSLFDFVVFGPERAIDLFGPAAYDYITFIYGIAGAVMIGWMVPLIMIIIGPFRRGETFGWNVLTLSVVTWFVIDSIFSAAAGYPTNVAFNTAFFVLFAIPLAATYRHFYPRQLSSSKATV